MRDGEGEAAIHAPTVEQDGTGATLTVVAALLGTGESQTFAQRVQERRAGIDDKSMRCPVHPEGDLKIHSSYALLIIDSKKSLSWLFCLWIAGTDSCFALSKCKSGVRCSVSLRFEHFNASNLLLQRGHVLLQFLHVLFKGALVLFKHETTLGCSSRTLAAQLSKAHHLCTRHACIP